jgi:hypothetical protein
MRRRLQLAFRMRQTIPTVKAHAIAPKKGAGMGNLERKTETAGIVPFHQDR